jgi:hypothetical protein
MWDERIGVGGVGSHCTLWLSNQTDLENSFSSLGLITTEDQLANKVCK